MAQEDRTHSPFIFADTLIRAGLNLAAVDMEWVMGVTPRGSYCRDVLDASRLLDMYALLGVPLRVTLGYPSAAGPDLDADPEMRLWTPIGCWGDGFSPTVTQAELGRHVRRGSPARRQAVGAGRAVGHAKLPPMSASRTSSHTAASWTRPGRPSRRWRGCASCASGMAELTDLIAVSALSASARGAAAAARSRLGNWYAKSGTTPHPIHAATATTASTGTLICTANGSRVSWLRCTSGPL